MKCRMSQVWFIYNEDTEFCRDHVLWSAFIATALIPTLLPLAVTRYMHKRKLEQPHSNTIGRVQHRIMILKGSSF